MKTSNLDTQKSYSLYSVSVSLLYELSIIVKKLLLDHEVLTSTMLETSLALCNGYYLLLHLQYQYLPCGTRAWVITNLLHDFFKVFSGVNC